MPRLSVCYIAFDSSVIVLSYLCEVCATRAYSKRYFVYDPLSDELDVGFFDRSPVVHTEKTSEVTHGG